MADLLTADLLIPQLEADSKIGAIKELVDRLHRGGVVTDTLSFLQSVPERENLQSTILGGDVALPHARSRTVSKLGLALGTMAQPIDFPSGDDRCTVQMICLIAVPAHAPDLYLSLLAIHIIFYLKYTKTNLTMQRRLIFIRKNQRKYLKI